MSTIPSPPRPVAVGPERMGPLWLGWTFRIVPMLTLAGLVEWHGMTLTASVIDFFLVAGPLSVGLIVLEIVRPARPLRRWSLRESVGEVTRLFLESFVLGYLLVIASWWIVAGLRSTLGLPAGLRESWVVIGAALLLLDAGYYWWHRLVLHGRGLRSPLWRWIRRQHARHHEVQDLDLFRGNVVSRWDAMFSHQVPLGIICGALGLSLPATLVAFGLTMLAFSSHHVNHTLRLGVLRHVLVDNHVHKLHHCRGGGRVNLGNFFSMWDRLFGTYREDWSRSATEMHSRGIRV